MSKRVFIGVGHGGKDPGAVGRVVEKDANLTVALAMMEELTKHGVAVGISRTTDVDDGMTAELTACAAFAPDLAVEVHANAGGGDGCEIFAQTGANASSSRAAAEAILRRVTALGQQSRGVKTRRNSTGTADYYAWLRKNACPAVLCEGFFVDSADADGFDSVDEQRALGAAYALGVLDYLGIPADDAEDDSTPDAYAREAVARAVAAGVLRGNGRGDLRLHDPITRQDAVVLLARCGALR